MDLQLAVFVFAEVEYLVNQAAEYPHVLLRNLHEGVLLQGEVVGRGELRNGLRDERQRRAQVVRHVGEEYQFGLGGVLELFVEPLLLVALLLQKAVLLHELLLVAAVLPPGSQQEESDAAEQQDDGDAGVEERLLGGVFGLEEVNPGLEQFDFAGLLLQYLVLPQQDVGVAPVHGRRDGQDGLPLVGLVLQNGERRADEAVPLRGIEERRIDDAVGHRPDADVGGGVNTYYLYVVASEAAGNLRRPDGHAVVVGIDEVRFGMDA